MSGYSRLLLVCNADSRLENTRADIDHNLISPGTDPCESHSLTHGYLSGRAAWRDFLEDLPATCKFLHRDQFRERRPDYFEPLPVIFCLGGGRPVVALGTRRISTCGSLIALMREVRGVTR